MIVMHLRQRAVATFDGRGSPLKGGGTLRRPRLPIRQDPGRQLLGQRGRFTRGLPGLESLEQLGFASWATCAGCWLLPIHERQQHLFNPSPPHGCEGHGLHSAPNPLPPKIHQGAHTSELLVHLVHRLLFDRQSMRCDSHFNRFDLGVHLAFHCV